MTTDSDSVMNKTWIRNLSSIQKIAYADGAADGQAAAYQTSFNIGYEKGFSTGFELGSNRSSRSRNIINNLQDTRKINCQICINGAPTEENIGNLYNIQQEKNLELINNLKEQ
ncbi:uncharacterized protein LOC114245839 [Bombyx mandarina]|uniref:Essential protein Yae1 N-terminal domain-containing protein n=2 Tax=Bombyx TaxID=7090 RepID=A0A8R1WI86_BOMMO|nr:uncharacterized protein LOC101737389 [Bombyx mori]XP_028033936.1 uncharacterized protein LOC114245839 [Bombyx mandarina]